MKKIICISSLLFSSLVFADDGTGYFVGLDAGSAQINYQPNTYQAYTGLPLASEIKYRQGLAYDAYFGYRLYRELGWELGFMQYQTAKFEYTDPSLNMNVKRYDYDLFIRGDYPLFSEINAFIKVGVARVNTRLEASTNVTSNVTAWSPAYGLGLGYEVTEHTELNTQYLHVNKVRQNVHSSTIDTPDIPRVNYFSLGAMYRF